MIALVLLAMPIARPEANPIAGGVGVLSGYLGGLALRGTGAASAADPPAPEPAPAAAPPYDGRDGAEAHLHRRGGRRRRRAAGRPDRASATPPRSSRTPRRASPACSTGALADGGWYGSAHEELLVRASSEPDPRERLEAVRALVDEQTRVGMLVGVAVGFELAGELARTRTTTTEET